MPRNIENTVKLSDAFFHTCDTALRPGTGYVADSDLSRQANYLNMALAYTCYNDAEALEANRMMIAKRSRYVSTLLADSLVWLRTQNKLEPDDFSRPIQLACTAYSADNPMVLRSTLLHAQRKPQDIFPYLSFIQTKSIIFQNIEGCVCGANLKKGQMAAVILQYYPHIQALECYGYKRYCRNGKDQMFKLLHLQEGYEYMATDSGEFYKHTDKAMLRKYDQYGQIMESEVLVFIFMKH